MLARSLLWRIGASNSGSKRPSRASHSASRRSVLRWLRAISATWRGLATTTSWPSSATTRLSHGERGPASSTTRARGRSPSTLLSASAVVRMR